MHFVDLSECAPELCMQGLIACCAHWTQELQRLGQGRSHDDVIAIPEETLDGGRGDDNIANLRLFLVQLLGHLSVMDSAKRGKAKTPFLVLLPGPSIMDDVHSLFN